MTPAANDDIPQQLRLALRNVPAATAVVLMSDGSEIRGATVTSFMPVSLNPPAIAVGIGRGRWLHSVFTAANRFTVNVLAAGQEYIADRYASSSNRRSGVQIVRFGETANGLPCIDDCVAVLECERSDGIIVGDHTVHVALVHRVYTGSRHDNAETGSDPDPLLWHHGSYAYVAR